MDFLSNLEKCFKYIGKIKESELKPLYPQLSDDLEEQQKSLINQKLSIILLGGTSSGKTTFANFLCSFDENIKDYPFNKELMQILPQDRQENTFFTWKIEASEDERFALKKGKEEKKIYEKIEEFSKEIKEINEEQKKHIKNKNSNKRKNFLNNFRRKYWKFTKVAIYYSYS